MKEEHILNVLMYLFEKDTKGYYNFVYRVASVINLLENAGFELSLVNKIIDCVIVLISKEPKLVSVPRATSIRVIAEKEREYISADCLGLITLLESHRILTPETRELVFNKIQTLQFKSVGVGLLKWIILLVLFNQCNVEEIIACVDFFVLDSPLSGVH